MRNTSTSRMSDHNDERALERARIFFIHIKYGTVRRARGLKYQEVSQILVTLIPINPGIKIDVFFFDFGVVFLHTSSHPSISLLV